MSGDAQALTPLQVLRRHRAHRGTLGDFVASRGERQPDAEFMVHDGRAWTWAETERDAARTARALARRGVRAGDRVMAMAANSAQHVLLLLAAARLGAVFVPVNPQFKVEEAAYVIGHCTPRLVLCDAAAADTARAAVREAGIDAEVAPLDPDATCIVIYTSGTTGFPKGVMHSQRSLVLAGEAFVERLHLQPSDRLLLILPMFHINAIFYSVAGTIAAGATLLVEARFSASTFWQRVAALRATQVNIIEAVAAILLARPESECVPGHPLRKVYGVRWAMVERLRARFGIPVLVGGYAMTEIPGVLSTPLAGGAPHSMGELCRHPDPAQPWAACRIVDDAGADVPDGTPGELLVRTPILMQGYLNDPTQTAASLDGGWFRTGDLVHRDADGAYYFVARKKDIIRRRGENIAGPELDRVVGEHPGVLVAAAIGVPSEMGDEDVLVAARPRDGATLSERDIHDWCRTRLAPMKVPRYVVLLDEMPLTPTHKVAKAELRKDDTLRRRAVDFGA